MILSASVNNSNKKPSKFLIDTPIKTGDEDVLGRKPEAYRFAKLIRNVDASHGLTIGVLGPWGQGKTSFINLMREQLELEPKLTVVDFNPWMFSGSEQLVSIFFAQIGAELKIRDKNRFGNIVTKFAEYSDILEPLSHLTPVSFLPAITKVFTNKIRNNASKANAQRSVTKIRQEITKTLGKLNQPIVVIIDDIDRLTTTEIREIFKLVRLTANFPNIIYLLAFDRARVETALTEDGIPGRAYLEKIIQMILNVPPIPNSLLQHEFFNGLDNLISPFINESFNEQRWQIVYYYIIKQNFSNLRDIKRYLQSVSFAVDSLGSQIDLIDLLAIETFHIFHPDILLRLSALRDALTFTGPDNHRSSEYREQIQNLLTEFSNLSDLLIDTIKYIFPNASRYLDLADRGHFASDAHRALHRLSHIDYFNLYFDWFKSSELFLFRKSESAFLRLKDANDLKEYLLNEEPTQLEDIIDGLCDHTSKLTADMTVPTSVTLLNLLDTMIPIEKERSILDVRSPETIVSYLIIKLLEIINNEEERKKSIEQILEGIETYSSQLHLINLVGHKENIGSKLVDKDFATKLEEDFIQHIVDKQPSEPRREWDAARVYYLLQTSTGEIPLKPTDEPSLLRSVIHSLKRKNKSATPKRVHIEIVLKWDILVKLFGSEEKVKQVVSTVRNTLGDDEVLQLVDKYLDGWRPEKWRGGNDIPTVIV